MHMRSGREADIRSQRLLKLVASTSSLRGRRRLGDGRIGAMEARGEGAITCSTIAIARTENKASPRTPAHFVRAGRRAWKLSARTLASGNLEALAHADADVPLSRCNSMAEEARWMRGLEATRHAKEERK